LTIEGRKQARSLGKILKALEIRPEAILTSPLVRAWETAELIANEIRKLPALTETLALAPAAEWKDLKKVVLEKAKLAAGQKGSKKVSDTWILAVGHQPNLSEMAAAALTGKKVEFQFDKGACLGLAWKSEKLDGPPSICLAMDQHSIARFKKAT
jgi:phosphohistidine phosphatase